MDIRNNSTFCYLSPCNLGTKNGEAYFQQKSQPLGSDPPCSVDVSTDKSLEKFYKEFLAGAHPEIKVTHTRADGCVANARLKVGTKFFK